MKTTHTNAKQIQQSRHFFLLIPLALLFVLLTTGQANAQRIITFDAPGAGTGPFQGTGCSVTDCTVLINDEGSITGYYLDANNVYHGFLRSPEGKFTTLDAPGADTTPDNFNGTLPSAINDAGAITGVYYDVSGGAHGFLRSPRGAYTTFDVTGSPIGTTVPRGLNLEGAIVGLTTDQNGAFRPFLRRPDGTFATWSVPGECDIPNTTGCFGSAASTINLFGTISAGYEDNSGNFVDHGLLRSADGKLTTYNDPGAGTGLYQGTGCPGCARPINLFGEVAGYYIDANNVVHGYLRSPWGEFTTFDVPGEGPQGLNCYADCSLGLNDFGAITGYYLDANDVFHGYVRSPEGKTTTFDAPGADTNPGDFNGTYPNSINDAGVITGNYQDTNSTYHAFVLIPYGRNEPRP
jgi:uncharacterized membrane protein